MKLGRGIGGDIIAKIKSAKNRIWIISPFISREYMDILRSKHREGIDVRVLTMGKADFDYVRRPKEFAHAKIYIIDDSGFYGSMNLTSDGVNKNYEVIAQAKKEDLPKLEEEFLKLWEKSIPTKGKIICERSLFKKIWSYELPFIESVHDVKYTGDRFYITTSNNLICLSANGEVLWRVPLVRLREYHTAYRIKDYGHIVLTYCYYSSKPNSKALDCVKVYLIREDGIIESSFDYVGHDPWAVYYDPEREIIGILEKMEDGYRIIGLNTSGDRIEYDGRRDIKFFLPSVVRGDGTIEIEIPAGDKFKVSPNEKMIVVIQSKREGYDDKHAGRAVCDNIVNIRVYSVDSKKLYRELVVNLGKAGLIDFAVDDDGTVYILTEDSFYVIGDHIQRVMVVKRMPMFEHPEKKITIQYPGMKRPHYYYYQNNRCKTTCQKIVLCSDSIIILLADIFEYRDEYHSRYFPHWTVHALIYSKDLRLLQVLKKVYSEQGFVRSTPSLSISVSIPQIFPFDSGFIMCKSDQGRIEYFRKINLRSKIEEFMSFLQYVAHILKIDVDNYRKTLLKLCEENIDELKEFIEREKQILTQELQTRKLKIEEELVKIISEIERLIKSGYNTSIVKGLLDFAKDTIENIDKNLFEAESRIKIIKELIRKSDLEQKLSIDYKIERIKNNLYKITLKLRTNSELGVIARIREIKGDVESYFEKDSVELCPESTIEIYLKLQENPPVPVIIEVEYNYLGKVESASKIVLVE